MASLDSPIYFSMICLSIDFRRRTLAGSKTRPPAAEKSSPIAAYKTPPNGILGVGILPFSA
jgi:hypothetical protein